VSQNYEKWYRILKKRTTIILKEFIRIEIESIAALRKWLKKNHASQESVWLVRFKKGKTESYFSYDEIVDELLCYGWIDSLPRKLDENKTMLLISPRKNNSNWSKVNKTKVEKLIQSSRMQQSGLTAIKRAKKKAVGVFSMMLTIY
jgi:uncharacterized protein YdeI (YjbR/CyaY-like superfamily)